VPAIRSFTEFIREFSASWFSVVMGTGVFTTALNIMGKEYSSKSIIVMSHAFTFINFIFFFVILVPFLLKLIAFSEEVKGDFRDPTKMNFYMMFGIAMLTLSSNFSIVTYILPFYVVFWFAGTLTVILFEIGIMFLTFMKSDIQIKHISPVWFLGTTGLLLVPGSGVLLTNIETIRDLVIFLFDFSFGAGFFLYLALFAIWIYRFVLHKPLESARIPLFWINMGPIGAAITSLVAYFSIVPHLNNIAMFFALLFFGAGTWWFFMAILITIYYMHMMRISYRAAWWSFAFPLGQFLIGAQLLNCISGSKTIDFLINFIFVILAIIWCLNVFLTLTCLMEGKLTEAQKI